MTADHTAEQPPAPPAAQPPPAPQTSTPAMDGGGGATAGALPNIYWRSIEMEAVRALPDITALPPVEYLTLVSPQCYRCTFLRPILRPMCMRCAHAHQPAQLLAALRRSPAHGSPAQSGERM